MRANSLLSTGENLTEILGWALAGLLLAAVSTTAAFRLDAATFAVSAVALALMRYRAPVREAAEEVAGAFWTEVKEGFSFLRRERGLRANTAMIVVCVAGLGAAYPLTFLFADQRAATAARARSARWRPWSAPATWSARWPWSRSPRACARAGS